MTAGHGIDSIWIRSPLSARKEGESEGEAVAVGAVAQDTLQHALKHIHGLHILGLSLGFKLVYGLGANACGHGIRMIKRSAAKRCGREGK